MLLPIGESKLNEWMTSKTKNFKEIGVASYLHSFIILSN